MSTTTLADVIERAQRSALATEPDRDAALAAEIAAREVAARRARVLSLDLPITAADEDLLAADQLAADLGTSLPAVRAWLTDARRAPWLWLGGPTGRGKTLAASWAILARGIGRLVGARELERLHITRFGDETVAAYERVCRERSLLVLDDLGREDSAAKMQSALLDLVDQRRGSGHLTIVTSNMSQPDMRKRYPDPRLWSRVEGCSQWVADVGPDLRKAKP